MKTIILIIIEVVTLSVVLSTEAQGTFQNLNFELANTGSLTFALDVPVTSALPYWTVTTEGVQQTQIVYNGESAGAPAVNLIGPGYNPDVIPAPIDGNYSVFLQGSFPGSAAISQTGLIPTGTQSLFFEADPADDTAPPGQLELQVGTQVVPFFAVETEPTYTLYGANISAWANDTEPLTFTAMQDNTALNNWEIDDISFSTNAVSPEPNILALTAIGGLLFGARKRFVRR